MIRNEETTYKYNDDIPVDVEYTYAVNQYDVAKKLFLSKCNTETDRFNSRNEKHLSTKKRLL